VEWIFRWLRSYLICRLKGGDMERFFNLCRYQGIDCWAMSFDEGVCRCCMYLKDFWKIRPFARKTKVRVRIEKRCGLAFFLDFLKHRKGLWMGLAGCAAMLCFLSAHLWKLEFYGNSYYTEERLTKYLKEEEGISCGLWSFKVDSAKLEENLRLTFPDISWVSVRVEGTSLVVSLEEMVRYDTAENQKELPRYLRALKAGVITAMVTRSGVPKVTLGDTVECGDLLIDGVMEIVDDSETVTETVEVGADGDIWAQTSESYDRVYESLSESRNYGRASWKLTLSVGSRQIVIGKNPYAGEESAAYDRLTVCRSLWPGLWIQIDAYRPYQPVPSFTAPSQLKERAETDLSDRIREFGEKGVQILENNVKILMYQDRVEATGDFTLIEPIGEGTDVPPENIQTEGNGVTDEYYGNDD
jgi:similar to stage IV sporulation protein